MHRIQHGTCFLLDEPFHNHDIQLHDPFQQMRQSGSSSPSLKSNISNEENSSDDEDMYSSNSSPVFSPDDPFIHTPGFSNTEDNSDLHESSPLTVNQTRYHV